MREPAKRRVWAQLSPLAYKEAMECAGTQSLPEWIEHAILIHIERVKIQKTMRGITEALRTPGRRKAK